MDRQDKEDRIKMALRPGDPIQPATLKNLSDADIDELYDRLILGKGSSDEDITPPKPKDQYELDLTNPDLPKIKENKKNHQNINAVLDLLMPSGGSKWNKVDRSIEDVDTEQLSRLTDLLNNKLYFDPSVVTAGSGGFGYANKGEIKKAPEFETEDRRLQTERRKNEDARRTWNTGLLQEGKLYDQQMKLMTDYLSELNDVVLNGVKAKAIHDETNPEMWQLLRDFSMASSESRGLLRRLIEFFTANVLKDIR